MNQRRVNLIKYIYILECNTPTTTLQTEGLCTMAIHQQLIILLLDLDTKSFYLQIVYFALQKKLIKYIKYLLDLFAMLLATNILKDMSLLF